MAALKRQAIIISLYEDEKVETAIAFEINPEASYQDLDTGMKKLNALTDNTYSDTHIVNTVSLNEELSAASA